MLTNLPSPSCPFLVIVWPQLLPKEIDFKGPGSLVALLATPEVLEAAAVVTLLGGTVLWAINFAATAVGWVMRPRDETDDQANT